jgi:hypothetical protein
MQVDIVGFQTSQHTGPPKSQLEKHNAPQCCQYDPLLIHKQFLNSIPQHAWKEYLPPNPSHPPSSTTLLAHPVTFMRWPRNTEPEHTSKDGFGAWKAAILLGLRVSVPAIGLFVYVGRRWDWDDGLREEWDYFWGLLVVGVLVVCVGLECLWLVGWRLTSLSMGLQAITNYFQPITKETEGDWDWAKKHWGFL